MGGAMSVLFIETATPLCAVALEVDGTIHVRELDHDRRHVEALTPGIDAICREFDVAPRSLKRIVVDRGPGLFTGLRVGVATAIAMASAIGAELVSVTSLELLAHGLWSEGFRGEVLSLIDGRRGEVFAQSFKLSDECVASTPAAVRTPQELVVELGTSGAPVTFIGDGAERYAELFTLLPNVTLAPSSTAWLSAGIALGIKATPGEVTPLYLREADAVANFATRAV